MFRCGDAVGLNKPANNALQQTAAAFLIFPKLQGSPRGRRC